MASKNRKVCDNLKEREREREWSREKSSKYE